MYTQRKTVQGEKKSRFSSRRRMMLCFFFLSVFPSNTYTRHPHSHTHTIAFSCTKIEKFHIRGRKKGNWGNRKIEAGTNLLMKNLVDSTFASSINVRHYYVIYTLFDWSNFNFLDFFFLCYMKSPWKSQ